MKGYLSKYQALKLVSSIPHPHGMPAAVWKPSGCLPETCGEEDEGDARTQQGLQEL